MQSLSLREQDVVNRATFRYHCAMFCVSFARSPAFERYSVLGEMTILTKKRIGKTTKNKLEKNTRD